MDSWGVAVGEWANERSGLGLVGEERGVAWEMRAE